jgi:hypothetical protein
MAWRSRAISIMTSQTPLRMSTRSRFFLSYLGSTGLCVKIKKERNCELTLLGSLVCTLMLVGEWTSPDIGRIFLA